MMKKLLITGAGGFIGSHLAELLIEKGYELRALVRYNSKNDWGWLENIDLRNQIEVVTGDVRDYDSVFNALKGCNAVFHLAALIGIPYSYVSPKAYIDTNIIGTYNILQASKELNVEQIVITSTSETYGTAQYVPIDEKHPVIGQSPYSASKIAADQLAISFYRSFNSPIKIVRPFNTYGPRQSARAIIPSVIMQLLAGKNELELGNLSPTRDMTFVEDTCSGFYEIFCADSLFGEITNIGMNKEISIKDLVQLLCKLLGSNAIIQTETKRIRPEKSEVERLICNNDKIKNCTGWKPRYSLIDGLMSTIEWMKAYKQFYKTEIYNI